MRLLMFIAPALLIIIAAVELASKTGGSTGPKEAGLAGTIVRLEIVRR